MLNLISFRSTLGVRCPSLFGLKTEALLAMSGLAYKVKNGDVRKTPKGKLPVLDDDGEFIADSSVIKKHLEDVHGVDFDGSLSAEQRATAKAVQRMVENHLYFAMIHFSWVENSDLVRETYFKAIPSPVRKIVFKLILKKVKRDNYGHGMGRHERADILAFALEDIGALSVLLGTKLFFFGDKPTSIDATVYAALEIIMNSAIPSDLQDGTRKHGNLVDYCDRFRGQVFAAA